MTQRNIKTAAQIVDEAHRAKAKERDRMNPISNSPQQDFYRKNILARGDHSIEERLDNYIEGRVL